MGYKYNKETGFYEVWHSKRHPITRQPYGLRRTRVKTEAQARRVEKELIVAVEQKLHENIVPKWPEMVSGFCEYSLNRGLTKNTVENYRVCLEAHTFPIWKDRCVDTITTQEIRVLVTDRLADKAPSHQKNVLKFVRAVFEYGVHAGIVNRNPAPRMKFRLGDKIKKVLTAPQIEILLNTAKDVNSEWYPLWTMACYTGMRNGELYALTWDKVDLEQRTILVDCSWNNKDGFKSTKTGDDRILEIAPPLLLVLKEMKLQGSDSVFVLPRLSKWDKGEQARELRLFLEGLRLPPVRFHDLRASWCTLMLSKGIEPIRVMAMGGWKDIKTLRHYIRMAGIDIRGMTDDLELHNPSKSAAEVLEIKNFGSKI